jgi:hypothetical protein
MFTGGLRASLSFDVSGSLSVHPRRTIVVCRNIYACTDHTVSNLKGSGLPFRRRGIRK